MFASVLVIVRLSGPILAGEVKFSIEWGSSGFAEQRNLKKICCGIRNSSNFSAERRNSPLLRDADFLKNYKRNAEFS